MVVTLDQALRFSRPAENRGQTFRESLLSDDSFSRISPYMRDRFGMTEEDYTREEIVDSFTNQLRWFNSGNFVTTTKELAYLYSASPEARQQAAQAYELWDNTPGVFSQRGGTLVDRADATFDYALSLVADPVNAVSLGLGKLAARGAAREAAGLLIPSARQAAEAVATNAAAQGLRGEALRQAQRQAFQTTLSRGVQNAAYQQAARRAARREIVGAGAFDALAAVGVDRAYQEAQMLVGRQSEYNPLQGVFATLGGLTGVGFGLALDKLRGVSKLPLASLEVERSGRLIAEREAAAQARAAEELVPTKVAENVDQEKLTTLLRQMRTRFNTSWAERKKAGFGRLAEEGRTTYFDNAITAMFFLGDKDEGIKGLVQILAEAGAPAWRPRGKDDSFTNWMYDLLKAMNLEDEASEVFDNTVGKFLTPNLGNVSGKITLRDFANIDSAQASAAGQELNLRSQISRLLNRISKQASKPVEEISVREVIDGAFDETAVLNGKTATYNREYFMNKFEGLQSNLIRMLVTHPGTTALNLKGWAQASMLQSTSDILRGTLYAPWSGLNALLGRQATATKYRNLAGQMFKLQKQKFLNLVDPYGTYDSVVDYLAIRPEARDNLLRYLSGGVEASEAYRALGLDMDDKVNPNTIEKVLDAIQRAYGVQAVDLLTKTQEFMYSLDKQIRLKYGVSYNDFIQSDDAAKYLTSSDTALYREFAEIEATAVDDALRNVFAKSYGGTGGPLQFVAKIIEDARRVPVIGAMIPFGQFFNNTIAHIADHTGISLVHKYVAGTNRDPIELITKAAVGVGVISLFINKQREMLNEGLSWNQERSRTGAIIDTSLDFPGSFYNLAARLFVHRIDEGKIPEELYGTFIRTFGPEALSRSLNDSLATAENLIYAGLSADLDEVGSSIVDVLKASSQMYISGFTRFLDPANQIIALTRGEEYVGIDRNQEMSWVNKSFRYIDQFIESITGEPLAPQKFTATGGEQNRIPIGRIFGIREMPAQTAVQRLFNDVGRPDWMSEVRVDDPSVANRVNQIIFPLLEGYAEQVLENPNWGRMSVDDRKEIVARVLSLARGDTLDILKASVREGDDKMALIFEIEESNASRADRNRVLEIFQVSEDSLSDLDVPQLQIILHFLKDGSARNEMLRGLMNLQ